MQSVLNKLSKAISTLKIKGNKSDKKETETPTTTKQKRATWSFSSLKKAKSCFAEMEHYHDKQEIAKQRSNAVCYESNVGPKRTCSDEEFFELQVFKFGEQNDSFSKYTYDDQVADAMFYLQNYSKKPCSF